MIVIIRSIMFSKRFFSTFINMKMLLKILRIVSKLPNICYYEK